MKKTKPVTTANGNPITPEQLAEALQVISKAIPDTKEAERALTNLLTPRNMPGASMMGAMPGASMMGAMPGASMMAAMPMYGKAKTDINHELKRKQYGIYNGHSEWDLARVWFQTSNDHFFDTYGFNFVPRGRLFDEAKKSLR